MTEKQYKKLQQITNKICKQDDRAQDLLNDMLIQLSTNDTYNNLPEKDKLFFFIRSIKNQYYSNSSSFSKNYKKYEFDEIPVNYERVDVDYQEPPTLDWIKETLQTELKNNPDFWYSKGLFDLWIEHKGFIERIHKQTKIPRYSIKDTIKEVKLLLNVRWGEYKNNQYGSY